MRLEAYQSAVWGCGRRAGRSVGRAVMLMLSVSGAALAQDGATTRPAENDAGNAVAEPADLKPDPPGAFFLRREPLTGPIVTDRPDFTESTDAVPSGYVQLEAGYTFTYDREGDDRLRTHTAPEMLWRIGLFENFELRINWPGYTFAELHTETESRRGRPIERDTWSQGSEDMSIGFKYKFLEQDGLVPHFGVIGELAVPSGSAGFSSGDVEPAVKLLWAYDVTEWLSVAGNVNFAVPSEAGEHFFQTQASLSGAVALTDRLGTYVEYFGFYPASENTDCAHYMNGGFTYLITENLQVDVRAGVGLNEEADDFFTGLGFAWRF